MLPSSKILFSHVTRLYEPQDNSHGTEQVGHKKGMKQPKVNWDGIEQEEDT